MKTIEAKKILVIQLRRIGDVLLTTPIVEILRKVFPESTIDFLVEKPGAVILDGNPFLSNILVYDKQHPVSWILKIRKKKYDLVLDFLANPRTAWITFFSKASYRVGFSHPGRSFAYNIKVKPDRNAKYAVDFKKDLLKAIDINDTAVNMHINIPEPDRAYVDDFLKKQAINSRIIIGISSTSRRQARIWRKDYFAGICDRLIQDYNAFIVLLWGPGEKEKVREVASLMKNEAFIPPETDLKQLVALIEKCSLIITNDNGPMHLAIAAGTPVIAIFGPTVAECLIPPQTVHIGLSSDVSCIRCEKNQCGSMECMDSLTVDEVYGVIKKKLSRQ